ncbi:Hypothetical predicted protein [Olea europaea subsp. europaea]|uniref:Uncharacterized protein n=1 Tax=Olea europaea subsp. europaea TaxID=158383 RepID=A0A8S0UPG3_OLEEU|nr:Hypothetical predicted protein [Olea europaea subsp. europaea]
MHPNGNQHSTHPIVSQLKSKAPDPTFINFDLESLIRPYLQPGLMPPQMDPTSQKIIYDVLGLAPSSVAFSNDTHRPGSSQLESLDLGNLTYAIGIKPKSPDRELLPQGLHPSCKNLEDW